MPSESNTTPNTRTARRSKSLQKTTQQDCCACPKNGYREPQMNNRAELQGVSGQNLVIASLISRH
jgi:hypothetical protein